MKHQESQSLTVIRIDELRQVSGLSRSTIYEKLNPKSPRYDPSFPTRVHIGVSAVGWLRHEIEAWLISKKA